MHRYSGVQRNANAYVPPGARRTTGTGPAPTRAPPAVSPSTAAPALQINGAAAGLPAKPVTPTPVSAAVVPDAASVPVPTRSVSEAVPPAEKAVEVSQVAMDTPQTDANPTASVSGAEDKVSCNQSSWLQLNLRMSPSRLLWTNSVTLSVRSEKKSRQKNNP